MEAARWRGLALLGLEGPCPAERFLGLAHSGTGLPCGGGGLDLRIGRGTMAGHRSGTVPPTAGTSQTCPATNCHTTAASPAGSRLSGRTVRARRRGVRDRAGEHPLTGHPQTVADEAHSRDFLL
ncbi:hypothetical protein GCM10010420_15330 [Streptomyces glaucosporus]|uniref:Uncharacterized protein n=1 Tax=Streptomyces glaucosporus TaxID=284044 RepID=A0ABN3I057_9ACTN